MGMRRAVSVSLAGVLFTTLTLSGCRAVLGLGDYTLQDEQSESATQRYLCRAHADCPAPDGPANETFCTSKRRCAQLQTEDCRQLAGSELAANALVIGSLFDISGPDAVAELARQHATQLAVEEINAAGGIPLRDGGEPRSFLLIGCDATRDVDRAATHLAMLNARAVVGLTDSEKLVQVVRKQGIPASMLTLGLAIAPESINSLLDADLAWLMALTVEQRAPLIDTLLGLLQQRLRDGRSEPLRLAVLFRYDGSGRAWLSALRDHDLDGNPLGVPELHAGRVRIDRYPDDAEQLQGLIGSYRSFSPDIIAMLGPVEAVTGFMAPLEQAYERDAVSARPHYVLTEAVKAPALLDLARKQPGLQERVHGVGAALPARSQSVWESFEGRYSARFDDGLAAGSRVAAAYDAVYALAHAIAAIEAEREVGGRIAQALHWLEAPEQTAAPIFEVGPEVLTESLRRVAGGERIALDGASGALHWDVYGARRGGALEAWCLAADSGVLGFGPAPLTLDVASQQLVMGAAACDRWLAALGDMPSVGMRAQSGVGVDQPPSAAAGSGAQPAAAGSAAVPDDTMAAAAGSAAPSGAAGGPAMPVEDLPDPTAGSLRCGATTCQIESEQCCIAMVRPVTGPEEGDVSCRPREAAPIAEGAAGAAAPVACMLSLQCASDADCAAGSVCCSDAQLASCKPLAACTAEQGRRLACKTPAECAEGQFCCLHSNASTSAFTFTACETVCDISNTGVRLCGRDEDCQADPVSTDCNPSGLLPALHACWPRL
jgi:hypothetical protein